MPKSFRQRATMVRKHALVLAPAFSQAFMIFILGILFLLGVNHLLCVRSHGESNSLFHLPKRRRIWTKKTERKKNNCHTQTLSSFRWPRAILTWERSHRTWPSSLKPSLERSVSNSSSPEMQQTFCKRLLGLGNNSIKWGADVSARSELGTWISAAPIASADGQAWCRMPVTLFGPKALCSQKSSCFNQNANQFLQDMNGVKPLPTNAFLEFKQEVVRG